MIEPVCLHDNGYEHAPRVEFTDTHPVRYVPCDFGELHTPERTFRDRLFGLLGMGCGLVVVMALVALAGIGLAVLLESGGLW